MRNARTGNFDQVVKAALSGDLPVLQAVAGRAVVLLVKLDADEIIFVAITDGLT